MRLNGKKIITGFLLVLSLFFSALNLSAEPEKYKITISGGVLYQGDNCLGNGEIMVEPGIPLKAVWTPSDDAHEFQFWTTDHEADIFQLLKTQSAMSFIMPATDLVLTAVEQVKAPTRYPITVSGGKATDLQGNPIDSYQAGDMIRLTYEEIPYPDLRTLDHWVCDSGNYDISAISQNMVMEIQAIGAPMAFSVTYKDDPEKIAQSSAEEERNRYMAYGDFLILKSIANIPAPEQFTILEDTTTFPEAVQCFYHNGYKIRVYYAKKNNTDGYYLHDALNDTLIPFLTLKGSEGNNLIPCTPSSKAIIPGTLRSEVTIPLDESDGGISKSVPGYLVENKQKEQLVLIYLTDQTGTKDFYVYEKDNGSIKLTSYKKYEESHSTEETTDDSETAEEDTEDDEEGKKKKSSSPSLFIWIVIFVIILLLLLAALFVVFRMNKRQEVEEDEDGELSDLFADDEDALEKFDTSEYDGDYKNSGDDEAKPFETSFEDAFPEEMHIRSESMEELRADRAAEFSKTKEIGPILHTVSREEPESLLLSDAKMLKVITKNEPEKENEFSDLTMLDATLSAVRLEPADEIKEKKPVNPPEEKTPEKKPEAKPQEESEVLFRYSFSKADMEARRSSMPDLSIPALKEPYPTKKKDPEYREFLSEDDFEVIEFEKKKK